MSVQKRRKYDPDFKRNAVQLTVLSYWKKLAIPL